VSAIALRHLVPPDRVPGRCPELRAL